jgi:hypothetical protein
MVLNSPIIIGFCVMNLRYRNSLPWSSFYYIYFQKYFIRFPLNNLKGNFLCFYMQKSIFHDKIFREYEQRLWEVVFNLLVKSLHNAQDLPMSHHTQVQQDGDDVGWKISGCVVHPVTSY